MFNRLAGLIVAGLLLVQVGCAKTVVVRPEEHQNLKELLCSEAESAKKLNPMFFPRWAFPKVKLEVKLKKEMKLRGTFSYDGPHPETGTYGDSILVYWEGSQIVGRFHTSRSWRMTDKVMYIVRKSRKKDLLDAGFKGDYLKAERIWNTTFEIPVEEIEEIKIRKIDTRGCLPVICLSFLALFIFFPTGGE